MNIFVFYPSPWESALYLDDVRKNKAILETAQLLSSAATLLDYTHGLPLYKATHTGHPCTKWAMTSKGNYLWLLDYLQALGEQKKGGHKSLSLVPSFYRAAEVLPFPVAGRTQFANCARNKDKGLDFTHVTDVHSAYKMYIKERWKEKTISLSWSWGQEPSWRKDN